MVTLGNCCHDFPRLARESGYVFQLHTGRVNWSDISDVDIDKIIQDRDFEKLERSLVNVINCNLDRDYDVKILDSNFVKLFKLAQLGVDYLSYCEMYLDRCVMLLQSQLSESQQECLNLKDELQKKTEQIRKNKRKHYGSDNHKCVECGKVFMSEIYLSSHIKRRHRTTGSEIESNSNKTEKSVPNFSEKSQQTDMSKHVETQSTQTQGFETSNRTSEKDTQCDFQLPKLEPYKENNQIIDDLKNEMTELKMRLMKTEKSLHDKENSLQMGFPSYPYFVPHMFPYPFYPQQRSEYCLDQTPQTESTPEVFQMKNIQTEEQQPTPVQRQVKHEEHTKDTKVILPKETLQPVPVKITSNTKTSNPNLIPQEDIKPIPFPRKPKLVPTTKTLIEPFLIDFNEDEESTEEEIEKETTIVESITSISQLDPIPIKEPSLKNKAKKNFDELKEKTDSFFSRTKKSPKLGVQRLGQKLRKSWSSLYESVSASRESLDHVVEEKPTVQAEQRVNDTLKSLGVDPNWSKIPQETFKQKMEMLEHRRNLLTKEHPEFPSIRKTLENKITEKLWKKPISVPEDLRSTSNESLDSKELSQVIEITQTEPAKPVRKEQAIMYDLETDSSEASVLSTPPRAAKISPASRFTSHQFPDKIEQHPEVKPSKEFDLSVFQVGEGNKISTPTLSTLDELQSDLDLEDDFLNEFEEVSIKNISGHLKQSSEQGLSDRTESQSILKSQHNAEQSGVKKRVLFADEEKSRKHKEEDSWSLDSDLELVFN